MCLIFERQVKNSLIQKKLKSPANIDRKKPLLKITYTKDGLVHKKIISIKKM